MSASHLPGNRNSTPEANSSVSSTLRPPSSRAIGSGHHLRQSADMAAFASSPLSSRIRPSSEVYYNQSQQMPGLTNADDAAEKAAQKWIADIDQYETTLEEMATATLDQDFKDELSAIEQWFRVLSEAERTAALYALLQQTTQVQIRFFIQVLKQMSKSHPMSGVLSPANFENGNATFRWRRRHPVPEPGPEQGQRQRQGLGLVANLPADPLSNRLSDAMTKLNVDGARSAAPGRPPLSPGNKRNSALDPTTIHAMFPDAAAAIATQRARYTQENGRAPESNRNSAVLDKQRSPFMSTGIGGLGGKETASPTPASPWGRSASEQPLPIARPKSSQGPPSMMGHFAPPTPTSASLRSPRPQPVSGSTNLQTTTLTAPESHMPMELPILSPYIPGNGNWASMVNTPMLPTFNQQAAVAVNHSQADMVANATAMKLAALSTVNNRIALDDVRKFRRGRSNDGVTSAPQGSVGGPLSPGLGGVAGGFAGTNIVMVNEQGQVLSPQQVAMVQAQQAQQHAAMIGRRSRPSSPGIAIQAAQGFGGMGGFASPQNNGFLSAYDSASPLMNHPVGMGSLNLAGFGIGGGFGGAGSDHTGYLSDHSDVRGRSPRGRRGSSKPPEDPTDPSLLQDIPSWLRSLRLHKYTDQLKDLKWEQLVELDDDGLDKRGVNALGARRKMLKVFEQVKEARAEGKL